MSLIEDFYEDFIKLDKTTQSDEMGGFVTTWVEGGAFKGALVTKATTQQRLAEKQIGAVSYQLTVPINVTLEYHDAFKRKKDGKTFRCSSDSDDVITPKVATFKFKQLTAEEWDIK